MTEEFVTKSILRQLRDGGWEIVCFDFPQSGTGHPLHPDEVDPSKSQGTIIPDIVAVRDGLCLCFENKNRHVHSDFEKVNAMKTGGRYRKAFEALLNGRSVSNMLYGIGIPASAYGNRAIADASLVDFIVSVDDKGEVKAPHNPHGIRFSETPEQRREGRA